MSSGVLEMDMIEELKMRRWARENYVPKDKRAHSWHPVVHEEMEKKDYDDVATPLANPKYIYRNS
jgi:hypothetical protein